jgi:hypothetical protein
MMRRIRGLRALVAAVAALAMSVGFDIGPAGASTCSIFIKSYFDGLAPGPMVYSPGVFWFEGASAYFSIEYPPTMCLFPSGHVNRATQWVGIFGHNTNPATGSGGRAQVGYSITQGWPAQSWAQWDNDGDFGSYVEYYGPYSLAQHSSHSYSVYYGADHREHMSADGSDVAVSNFDPFNVVSQGGWIPDPPTAYTLVWSPEWSAEVFYPNTDVPGSASSHTYMVLPAVQRIDNTYHDAWSNAFNPPGVFTNSNSFPDRWSYTEQPAGYLQTWTQVPSG